MSAVDPYSSWSTPEVGYFIPNNNFKRHGRLKHMETGKDLIPRFYNVQAFVNHLRALLIFKHERIIKANIHSCLRDDALDWYDTELTDSERMELIELPLEQGWFKILLQRFELPYEIGLFRLETAKFGIRSGGGISGCQAARNLIRHAQTLGIEGTKNQLIRIWKVIRDIDTSTRKVPKPRSGTSISDFMRELDMLEQSRMYGECLETDPVESCDEDEYAVHGFGNWSSWCYSMLEKFKWGEKLDEGMRKLFDSRQMDT